MFFPNWQSDCAVTLGQTIQVDDLGFSMSFLLDLINNILDSLFVSIRPFPVSSKFPGASTTTLWHV